MPQGQSHVPSQSSSTAVTLTTAAAAGASGQGEPDIEDYYDVSRHVSQRTTYLVQQVRPAALRLSVGAGVVVSG